MAGPSEATVDQSVALDDPGRPYPFRQWMQGCSITQDRTESLRIEESYDSVDFALYSLDRFGDFLDCSLEGHLPGGGLHAQRLLRAEINRLPVEVAGELSGIPHEASEVATLGLDWAVLRKKRETSR